MTKQSGKAPQTHSAATIAKPNTTIASNVFDTKAPLPSGSTLEVLVNGEKAFGKVYEAINNAQNSVEIVCWGFQPSIEKHRGASAAESRRREENQNYVLADPMGG